MTVKEAIEKRRASKVYRPSKLTKEQLDALMEAGNLAPSPNNFQDSRIIVLQSDEAKKKCIEGFLPANHDKVMNSAATFLFIGIPYRMMSHDNGKLVWNNDVQYYKMDDQQKKNILNVVLNYYDNFADYSVTMDITTSAIQASFMMLEATELGLASTPMQGINKTNMDKLLRDNEIIQPLETINMALAVGQADPDSKLFDRIRRPIDETFKVL